MSGFISRYVAYTQADLQTRYSPDSPLGRPRLDRAELGLKQHSFNTPASSMTLPTAHNCLPTFPGGLHPGGDVHGVSKQTVARHRVTHHAYNDNIHYSTRYAVNDVLAFLVTSLSLRNICLSSKSISVILA